MGKKTYKLSVEGVLLKGLAPASFNQEFLRNSPYFCLETLRVFFEQKAKGQAVSFILKRKPPVVPEDIDVRFLSDTLKVSIKNRFFCNVDLEVVTC